jgi:hypothetical protein
MYVCMSSDARQLVQTVSKVADIPKSEGIFLFSLDLQIFTRDVRLPDAGDLT